MLYYYNNIIKDCMRTSTPNGLLIRRVHNNIYKRNEHRGRTRANGSDSTLGTAARREREQRRRIIHQRECHRAFFRTTCFDETHCNNINHNIIIIIILLCYCNVTLLFNVGTPQICLSDFPGVCTRWRKSSESNNNI